jgi:hypothetical protein
MCFDCGIRGYSRQKPGAFYVVEDGEIVKCGIANMVPLSRRLAQHRAQGLLWSRLLGFHNGSAPWQLEREWKMFRLDHPALHVSKSRLRDGYTEAMMKEPVVLTFVNDLLRGVDCAGLG